MDRDVALDTVQLNVDELPEMMEVGDAVNDEMVGIGALVTVTVAMEVTDPELLVAVRV
jgi:outer membrane usher protein FimD/PapC